MTLSKRNQVLKPALVLAMAVALLSLAPHGAQAATGHPTVITVAAPVQAELGQRITLQATLTDASGIPFPNADIIFSSPDTFMNVDGEPVIGEAMTDDQGVATAVVELRRTGSITINAAFNGDASYAPSKASASLQVTGSAQLYEQEQGVSIPGLNSLGASESGPLPHWALSGWPIAAVLIAVWSCYGLAVLFMSRIAREADEAVGEASGEGAADA